MTEAVETPSPKVLVVEDNPTTARTLSLFLTDAGIVVETANNGSSGLAAFTRLRPDLVLLDLMLPDLDGMDVCRRIREHSATPIVMLTARSTESDIVQGLECGADDYVTKPFGAKELLARVNRCLRRAQAEHRDPSRLVVGDWVMEVESRHVTARGEAVALTQSEFNVLRVLMAQPGRVFTRDQLIEQALGDDFDGTDRTIDTHIWSLRKKLGDSSSEHRYIGSEMGVGYRLVSPPSRTAAVR